ncbi:MAG: Cna B-type domain-containing protein, partial [Clostridia bacterium]|nr:Cna B-type domain-containing protein [Clostridia bacterium]
YTATVQGYDVTNKHVPETVTVEGSTRWEDENDQDGKRPESITVNLLANGEKIDSASVKAEDGWKWRFEDLPKYSGGKEIEYSITEEPVEGYTATVQGYDVINSHDIETIDIHVTKEWKDGNDKDAIRPRSIVIHLLADGKETASATLVPDKKGVWEHTFTGLPKYRDHGTEIAYTVTEEAVKGYTSKLTGTAQKGLILINEHSPAPEPEPYYFKFSFTKLWQGDHEDSIDWVMYHPDGTVAHKKFNKKVVSESEWHYEAWFASSEDYYIIENVPEGYKVRYENVGAHAGETDRCYNGGTIINYKVPKTGDPADLKLWLSYVLLGLGAVCSVWAYSKRKQTKI